MGKLKADNPRIIYRPTDKLKKEFKLECVERGVSMDHVLIELTYGWLVGRFKIPGEK